MVLFVFFSISFSIDGDIGVAHLWMRIHDRDVCENFHLVSCMGLLI